MLPENLVFLDEMGVLLGLQRSRGRCRKGQRLYCQKPFYRGQKVTVMGAMTLKGIIALQTLDRSMNGKDFEPFMQTQVIPQLWVGAVLVMDNLPAHKVQGIVEMVEAVGARVVFLSPYSPDFNPIELLWSQMKAFLRRFCPKTFDAVTKLLQLARLLSEQRHFRNWFAHCCHCVQ